MMSEDRKVVFPLEASLGREVDVFVAGGGTAGCAAAIAAARAGCSALLAEEANSLGGTSTTGLVNEWFAHTQGLGNIFDEVHGELKKAGLYCGGRIFNGEILKWIWQTLCMRAGVTVLFHTGAVGVTKKRRKITGATLCSCGKFFRVRAKYFIDATGEGDLAAAAGAGFMKGHPENHKQLHMSLIFQMMRAAGEIKPYLPEGMKPYSSVDETPGLKVFQDLEDGRVYCNMTKVTGRDSTDPAELSAAEAEARIQMMKTVHLLQTTSHKNYIPVASGAKIGVREGRRIAGDYILRAEDMLEGRSFPDSTVVATSQIDFHSLTKPGDSGWRKKVRPYGIPLRCLCVKDIDNMLTAGKCISADQIVHSSCRMTPTCCGMGQTVGIAAALAVKHGARSVRDLDFKDIREEMVKNRFELSPEKHKPFHLGAEGSSGDCD